MSVVRSASRLQSVVLTIAAIAIATYSCVPPWVEVVPVGGVGRFSGNTVDAPRLVITRPLGSWPLWDPPRGEGRVGVRIDYARLILYYLGTMALIVPFFAWRPRSVPARTNDRG